MEHSCLQESGQSAFKNPDNNSHHQDLEEQIFYLTLNLLRTAAPTSYKLSHTRFRFNDRGLSPN